MEVLLTAMLCALTPACVFSSTDATHSEQPDPWFEFRSQFYEAFDNGDVEKLEALKNEWSHKGFANINDLGQKFMKYGSGMGQWDALIADAKKNKK